MNYYAPTRKTPKPKQKTMSFWQGALIVLGSFKSLYAFVVELPLNIVSNMGIINMPSWWSIGPGLCSLCICGAFMAVGTSVGVGLGVGIGVGLSCALSNNTVATNSTVYNTTNATATSQSITLFMSGSGSPTG